MSSDTVISFERETYKDLCEEMKSILQLEKEVAAKKEEVRKRLIEQAGGDRMEYGVKVEWRVAQGSIDYKAMANELIGENEELAEKFRKPAKGYWQVRSY